MVAIVYVEVVIEVPEVVRNKAVSCGAEAWLAAIPDLVAQLEQEWSFTVGPVFDGGTEAVVATAVLDDGAEAVVKLLVPRRSDEPDESDGPDGPGTDGAVGAAFAEREIVALRLADGRGCVRLYRADEARGAMLLERLGPSMFDLGVPFEDRLIALTDAAMRFWQPAAGLDLPTGEAKARHLATTVVERWERLDHPCAEQTVAEAVACADRRANAHKNAHAVVVHGDIHQWNALVAYDADLDGDAAGLEFKLIDPDGFAAEPEYDLGILMREDPLELELGEPFDRARRLADRTGLDADAIWEWGVIERVSTGLLATEIGLQPVGRQMLELADRIAAT